MSDTELNRLAAELKAELADLEDSPEVARERLRALHEELEQRLAHPREDNQDEQLIAQLTEAISAFEASHPRATAILNQVLQSLANLGI